MEEDAPSGKAASPRSVSTSLIKAQKLYEEAKRKKEKLSKSIVILGSKSQKYEDIADIYSKAAKMYQLAKENTLAANAFVDSAQCYLLMSNFGKHNAATCYINAAHCFAKDNQMTNAMPIMLKAIEIYTDDGKFSQAAKYAKEVAEMFEQANDIPNAVKHYELSSEWYEMEGSVVTGSACLLKVALLAADIGDYHKSIEFFEKASEACSGGIAKYSNKENYLKAGIMYLCLGDVVAAKKALDKWCTKLPEFCKSREQVFLNKLIQAYEELDAESFKEAVKEWDDVTTLDVWKRGYLVKVLETVEGNGEEEDLT